MTGTAPARRAWLVPVLVAVFILVSVAEVWLLTFVGIRIGIPWTLAILIAGAVLGAWLMHREGNKAWRALVDAYTTGKMPSGQLADAALVLVGGLLLILPGFLTDIVGLICLLPWTRPAARRAIGLVAARQAARSGFDINSVRSPYANGTVVEGETVADPEGPSDPPVVTGEIEE
ncbi:MAG: FxsA family protein [Propionibacteriaceae bacterium]|nr:FxsA family protein [Propionibacteriaceae bacterium]